MTVDQTAAPTFGLVARRVDAPNKSWRLLSRVLGGTEDSRVLQYRKPSKVDGGTGEIDGDAQFTGIRATILDGELFVFSQQDNPKLHGFNKVVLPNGSDKPRQVLGAQSDNQVIGTSLTGCTVDMSRGNVLSCTLGNGSPARFQELEWPSKNPKSRRFMLGLLFGGGDDARELELVARDYEVPDNCLAE